MMTSMQYKNDEKCEVALSDHDAEWKYFIFVNLM